MCHLVWFSFWMVSHEGTSKGMFLFESCSDGVTISDMFESYQRNASFVFLTAVLMNESSGI
jgi:hypothetical protein